MEKREREEVGYHDQHGKKAYFEGWYYKVSTKQFSMAIIVGIMLHTKDDHAFIQVLDTHYKTTQYHRFPVNEMEFEDDPFHIHVQGNHFYKDRMSVHIEGVYPMRIQLELTQFTALEKSLYAPNIMGPFAYLPHMQCVHGVLSLHHYVDGIVTLSDHCYELSKAVGYMEKDRGTSFPQSYMWLQSNTCLEGTSACFFLALASIPLSFLRFTGLICVLEVRTKQYRFATYKGARIQRVEEEPGGSYQIEIKQYPYTLKVEVHPHHSYPLYAPIEAKMKPMIYEGLEGKISVRLLKHGALIELLHYERSGCEIHNL